MQNLDCVKVFGIPPDMTCACCRYLTPEGIEECIEDSKNSPDDIIRVALDVSTIVTWGSPA